jgi:GalNAc-alpha-(1->4)-GalNAc-alpha-(1->3)-diNAcBac-PP-undecaprenol alpha-1,4-N-acetyl-D-galactosaminyltransferase
MGTRDGPSTPLVSTAGRNWSPDGTARVSRRIVIIVGSIAAGGAERVAATMANAWCNSGDEVRLVSTYLGARAAAYPIHPGVSVVLLSEAMPGSRLWPPIVRKIRALYRLLRSIEPDVIISLLTNVNVLTILAHANSGIPLIISERTDPLHDRELPSVLRLARTLCYRFADALVVQSTAAAQRYGARLPGVVRTVVIHNPLPAQLADGSSRAQQDGAGGCVIAMGRLTPEKGYAKLIDAFAAALGDDRSWQLRIWGDGPLREDLQSRVDRLQLADRVQLCGLTDQPWPALAAGQIFVLSSEYEGFPNAMLEAMALGLPCIAFDCPSGPRELADAGRAAMLIPPGDVGALATALRALARDRALRTALGERAAAFVRGRFAQESIMADWDALIEEVMARDASDQRMRSSE